MVFWGNKKTLKVSIIRNNFESGLSFILYFVSINFFVIKKLCLAMKSLRGNKNFKIFLVISHILPVLTTKWINFSSKQRIEAYPAIFRQHYIYKNNLIFL